MARYLIVDQSEIMFTDLWSRFQYHWPAEMSSRWHSERQGLEINTLRYWIAIDDPLVTECLLREIGRIEEH